MSMSSATKENISMTTMNRLHNVTNPYQGKTKKVLCVCSAGLLRSPTTANVLHREFGYNTRACGVNPEFALIAFDTVLAEWADEIVVMETWMGHILHDWKEKVICLNVPDSFAYMNEELQKLIKENYINATKEFK